MMNQTNTFMLTQLAYSLPMFLVCLVAFALALLFMNRAPTPSFLTMIGIGILVVTTVSVAGVQSYFIQKMQDGVASGSEYRQLMTVLGVAGSCLRGIGMSFLVAAIFTGRGRSTGTTPKSAAQISIPVRIKE